jgi:hypothetical protein
LLRLTVISWSAHQWPGTTGGTPNNPWEFEMVLLNHEANGKKENVGYSTFLMFLLTVAGLERQECFHRTKSRREGDKTG